MRSSVEFPRPLLPPVGNAPVWSESFRRTLARAVKILVGDMVETWRLPLPTLQVTSPQMPAIGDHDHGWGR